MAAKEFDASIETGRTSGDKTIVLSGIMGLAGVAAALGNSERAARLLGASDAIREAIGYRLWTGTLTMYARPWIVCVVLQPKQPIEKPDIERLARGLSSRANLCTVR